MKKRSHQKVLDYLSGGKRGIVSEYLPWILIAVAVLAILMIAAFTMKTEGTNIIDKVLNLFRGH